MMTHPEFGVTQVAHRIHERLRRYLEAQYHIRDTGLIDERRQVLDEPGGISQRPFVEVTPSYAVLDGFANLQVPVVVKALLQELSVLKPAIGVFPPYVHQAQALERFFSHGDRGDDLIVATGTGSGKTETFLYAILGALALEGAERPKAYALPGVRALLLYPMNALVSDQTARLRRLIGDPGLAELFRDRWGRHPRFGMYTSRTPYPGVRSAARDARHLAKLLEYYENLETSSAPEAKSLVRALRERGRWPAKDIVRFFAREKEETRVIKTGKRVGNERTYHHWQDRFTTQPDDRELLTRHEMQQTAPDLLVTNYSMLEYMLLRPIERPVFSQTRTWLDADTRNQLLLILDEAHMYRGVGGAEVGLLLRRLASRLGIDRGRLRCVLTSASLGSGDDSDVAGRAFAKALTGDSPTKTFAVVRGTREVRPGGRPGTLEEARALSSVDPVALAAARLSSQAAEDNLRLVATGLEWQFPPSLTGDDLPARQHLCRQLTGFGPLELLIATCSGNATAFADLAKRLFPEASQGLAEGATDGLLALGTFARRTEPNREEQPLLPTRVHLLFRGLPSLHVCINPVCTARRERPGSPAVAGRLFTEPRTHCDCGGRVYELLTHRDCGAAYIRVFGSDPAAEFFWHERGGLLTEFGHPLHELHLLLDEPHPCKADGAIEPVVLDVATGRVLPIAEAGAKGARLVYRSVDPPVDWLNLSTFGKCPACGRRTKTGGTLKIMDLATKGEQPFANLVREQFVSQVATKAASRLHPNEGRKALLFSDGRQKAARLARDLPREVERDSFREALVLAVSALSRLVPSQEAVLDERLYAAFVSVCARFHLHFFDDADQRALLEDCDRFERHYGADLALALDSEWKPVPPSRYRRALLRQISDPYYSLVAACAAVVEPRNNKLRLLRQRVTAGVSDSTLAEFASAWILDMLAENAFDPALSVEARIEEFSYFQAVRAREGQKRFFEGLRRRAGLSVSALDEVRDNLFDIFTRESTAGDDSGRLITNDSVALRLAIDATWQQCAACGHVQMRLFANGCVSCGVVDLEPRPPDHPYMIARKGFFREPLVAVLQGERPIHITAEEHTAQLSHRDAGVVYATTEQFELRFQDVPLPAERATPGSRSQPPVDILSCTTTMEVGIDIGALTAVGLRTVPPQRENYQQRAGRAGRRGSSVSSVLTFAQGGAHDAYYFGHPHAIISGPPRSPRIKSDNRRLARRHIHAHLLQTFFHGQIDLLPPVEQERLRTAHPGLMSAFGDAREFFHGTEAFSYTAFDKWLATQVLGPRSDVLDEIAAWLPPEIAPGPESYAERREFARSIAEQLDEQLRTLQSNVAPPNAGTSDDDDDIDAHSLLEMLFDNGLLPSYAFPTDLSSFVIQDWAQHGQVRVAERPQLARVQALSEYAPGRLLVVNKRTYRVGGIFVEGAPTAAPVASLFLGPLRRYIGCPRCAFVRMESGTLAEPTVEGAPCPVCETPLFVRDFLDPPAFSPEMARALREGDRDQEITYASAAQLPELVQRGDYQWRDGPGLNLRHTYGEDVVLVVANKGQDSAGFSACTTCGAAWLDGEEAAGAHPRPFLLPNYVRQREQVGSLCSGAIHRGLYLGHEFRTDVLLLRASFCAPFDFSPQQPWLYDALATLAEALALGASLSLDIDPGELSAGFRLQPPGAGEVGGAEIYLFDTASGGAGYAADAGSNLESILAATEDLLHSCPARCERSCTECLRHYGNRFLHPRLDRHLASTLLRYMRYDEVPAIAPAASQSAMLEPLRRYLELEGWTVSRDPANGRPLTANDRRGRTVVVGTYPALLAGTAADTAHRLSTSAPEVAILLPDYVVQRDLPSAYQIVSGVPAVFRSKTSAGRVAARTGGVVTDLPVRDLRRLMSTNHSSATVRLRTAQPVPTGAFAVRVPTPALSEAGFIAGEWLVFRPLRKGEAVTNEWVVVLRARGSFRATNDAWTIARATHADSGPAVHLSYGDTRTKERQPEQVKASDVSLAAILVCVADETS